MGSLADNEKLLRDALAVAGIGVWQWDMISDGLQWDKRQFELFGRDEVEGEIPLSYANDVIHPDDRAQLAESANRVLTEGATANEEFRVIDSDGAVRWLLGCSGVVQLDDDRSTARLIGFNMDITEHKVTKLNLDAEVARHQETLTELAMARRLESLGQLAGGVAHDFNNLLAVIGGNLELAALKATDETRDLILEAQTAVESGVGLSQRLLQFARKRELNPVTLSVSHEVLEINNLLKRTLAENISIKTIIDPELWNTFADLSELNSALLNVAVNARDAMPDGGDLLFECINYVLSAEDAQLDENVQPGEYVGLMISDSGTGMTPEVLQKAIDPFYSTKETGKGNGLGLSSVYGFAQQSGGFLKIDSTEGIGTTVCLCLPRCTNQLSPVADERGASALHQSKGESILVVEDNPMMRKITVKKLELLGYQVFDASNGQEAIDLLQNGLSVELVFSDIIMPGGLSGYDITQWVSAHRPDIKMILTSGYHDPDSINTHAAVDTKIIYKPYTMEQLSASFQEALNTEN